MRFVASLFLLAAVADAAQLPFKLPFWNPEKPAAHGKIAIIGGGAAGSSSAFWLHQAKERFGLDIDIHLFEKDDRIGGRTTVVYPFDDRERRPVELGASIFVAANKILHRATREFGLELNSPRELEEETGVWDGERFVVRLGNNEGIWGWLDTLKLLWRYGYRSPATTKMLVQRAMETFLSVYSTLTSWSSIEELSETLNFTNVTANTAANYFHTQGVGRLFTEEIIEAATRVNYGQDIDDIHALAGMVSMAASGAASVKGGNYQIFERMLDASSAKVHLNSKVQALRKRRDGRWELTVGGSTSVFDDVIVAAPLPHAGFEIQSIAPIPQIEYVHLHVTLLTTPATAPNPEYFGLTGSDKVPRSIVTTNAGVRHGGRNPQFNSMSYLDHLEDRQLWVVKLFSKEKLSDETLQAMFGTVEWVYRKEWDAYPKLPPTTMFPPTRLGGEAWYVNAMEPLMSTMETSTLAARGVVDDLLRVKFGHGLCPSPSPAAEEDKPDFLWGWDC